MGLSSAISSALSSTTNTLSNITSIAQQYVVAPMAAFGVAGFVFDLEGESIASLTADITDHYTEQNQALQDHIAIKPKRITLKGYVGEVIYHGSNASQSPLQKLGQKLGVISAYLPQLTSAAVQTQSLVNSVASGNATFSSVLTSTSNIYGVVQNILGAFGGPTSHQQNIYMYFKSLMQSATLMGIQTPWEFMTNMAIESIIALQDEKTQSITDFAVTLKEIRIASTLTTAYSTGGTGGVAPAGGTSLLPNAAIPAATQVNLGSNPGTALPYASLPGQQGLLTSGQSFAPGTPIANVFNAGVPN